MALGLCQLAEGEIDRALTLIVGCLEPLANFPDPTRLAYPLEALAMAACGLEDYERAARLHGAAKNIRSPNRTLPELFMRAAYEKALAGAHESLGDETFKAAVAEGGRLSRQEAITYAAKGRGPRKRPSVGWESLTPVELQVVRLIAQGLSNSQIAERMFLSRRTVESHVARSIRKLGFSTRLDLAIKATRREPA